MSRFERQSFADPPARYRVLQIVHGLDRYLRASAVTDGGEVDPAGDWGERMRARPEALGPDGYAGIAKALSRLRQLGVGGIVTNVGFQDYLQSEEQWRILRAGLDIARECGLRVWLYDEKGYPSGTAGGIVPRARPESVALGLACYAHTVEGPASVEMPLPVSCRRTVSAAAVRDPSEASLSEVLCLDNCINASGSIRWDVPSGTWTLLLFAERVMYEGTHAQGNVSEFRSYINLLDPGAVRAFLRVTHETYARELPADLWQQMEAMFTDEPSLMTFYVPPLPERYWGRVPIMDRPLFNDRPPVVPWCRDFLSHFETHKGYDLQPYLFALFYPGDEKARYVRQDYYDVVTRRYVSAFYGQVQTWCRDHGVAASGHVLLEEDILYHVPFHGDLFAAVRRMDLPGIDMLNSDPQDMLHGGSFMGASFMAAKQVASVGHLIGAERIHSESSDWEQRNEGRYASLAERRGQANLLYVLGINQITSYFGWQEFSDADQRAYHDYVARLSLLLTGGRHVCDVAVLYPIRTMWAHYLPPLEPILDWEHPPARSPWATRVSETYPAVVKGLLCSQIDLDIVDEQALLEAEIIKGGLHIADEVYRVLVLPPIDVLSLPLLRVLEAFVRAGGTILAVDTLPSLADTPRGTTVLRAELAHLFADQDHARCVALHELPAAVRQVIPSDVMLAEPTAEILVTHRILEGQDIYFLINNAAHEVVMEVNLRVPGPYRLYRPLTAAVEGAPSPLVLDWAPYEGIFIVAESDGI